MAPAAPATGGGTGKSDMDRIGLFSEMGYISLGDKYPRTHVDFSKCSLLLILYEFAAECTRRDLYYCIVSKSTVPSRDCFCLKEFQH